MERKPDDKTKVFTVKVALDPTSTQAAMFCNMSGAVRWAYNWCVSTVFADWDKNRDLPKEQQNYMKTYGTSLRDALNKVKDVEAPWWREVGKCAFTTGCFDAADAFKRYYSKQNGLPQYKKRRSETQCGIRFDAGKFYFDTDSRRHIFLPREIGSVRLHERRSDVARALRKGARLNKITVVFERGRWFAVLNLRMTPAQENAWRGFKKNKGVRKKEIGIDAGVKSTVVDSDGNALPNPYRYEQTLRKQRRLNKKLARQQKQVLDAQTGQLKYSNRREQTRKRLAKVHARVANFEDDLSHKITKFYCDEYDKITIENLNIKGMMRNHCLARRIAHAMFGRIKTQFAYKTLWYDNELTVADRWFPSSKKCCRCGVVKAKLRLKDRIFHCENCQLTIDRDLNAAINLVLYDMSKNPSPIVGGRGKTDGEKRAMVYSEISAKAAKLGFTKLSSENRQVLATILDREMSSNTISLPEQPRDGALKSKIVVNTNSN